MNGWVNSRVARDLRRYHAHYDVTVMNTPWLLVLVALTAILVPVWGEPPVVGEFPSQWANNTGIISMLWRHHKSDTIFV